ncbi:hypothetical protein [Bacillus phage SBSphiJ3]|nr:hypothetical protein [Bacillus phage SBSphiJ3]UPI12783.1 hypothetical protein [Bacillus phage SBSphiJ5]
MKTLSSEDYDRIVSKYPQEIQGLMGELLGYLLNGYEIEISRVMDMVKEAFEAGKQSK